jgi:probable DNA repair protein
LPRSLYDIEPLVPLIDNGFALLTPNFRLARRIKSEWDLRRAAGGATVWDPAPVLPLESWLQQQWQRAVALGMLPATVQISDAQEAELWRQVIEQEQQDSQQYHLLRPSAAAELAAQARQTLLRWQVDAGSASIRQDFALDIDCGTFLRWQDAFERRLAGAGQSTALDCFCQLLSCGARLPGSRLALLEFDDIPPLYRAIVAALSTELRELSPSGEPGQRISCAFSDKRSELQAVAHWAAALSREAPGTSIGIVMSDMARERGALEYLLRREFGCLGESYTSLPVNFSSGIALDRAPVVRDGLAVLELSGSHTTVAAVVALLQSRFLQLPDAGTPLANRFITRLFEAGRAELDTADLRYSACEVRLGESRGLALGQHLLATSRMRELRKPALPSRWVDLFSEILALWGWPGQGPLDSLEYQQVELWYRTLDEFRSYDAICQPMALGPALQLLRSSCARQISQPETADCNVQVLGPLEAAGLAFDHIWLCGMQAARWPAPARPSPFIPQSLQRRLQMPHATAEREWTFAARLLEQYTRSTPLLHASYCRQLDDVPDLPSPLLDGFSRVEAPDPALIDPDWIRQWRQRRLDLVEDNLAPPLEQDELESIGGGSGLLEDQSHCPFRAYAKRRLRVAPLGDFGLALSPGDRGSLLHEALNVLWGRLGDHQTLVGLTDSAELEIVTEAVRVAIQEFPERLRRLQGATFWQLEGQRLVGLLREWLAVERRRGEFIVSRRESEFSTSLAGLQLRLRVDRIDELPDGSQLIIDYKSGVSRVQDWLGERPARPQLLLYGVAAPDAAAALAFAQVRPRDSRFVGLGRLAAAPGIATDIGKALKGRMDADDWEALNNRWCEILERLASEFIAGQAAVDPLSPTSCTWCGLQPLCRVGIDVTADAPDEDGVA